MKNKISIIIANDDYSFALNIANYIKMQNDMEVLGIVQDGEEAIKMILEKKPNIVLLDLIMPICDGIGVLEKINELKNTKSYKYNTKFIIMAQSKANFMIQQALLLGVDYIFISPFNIQVILDSIRRTQKLCENNIQKTNSFNKIEKYLSNSKTLEQLSQIDKIILKDINLDTIISIILIKIGITPYLKGYHYIREALNMIIDNFSVLEQITRVLYPSIAKKFDSTPSKIERDIRNAIEILYSKPLNEMSERLFRGITSPKKGKPTNSEFLSTLAEEIRLALNIPRKLN